MDWLLSSGLSRGGLCSGLGVVRCDTDAASCAATRDGVVTISGCCCCCAPWDEDEVESDEVERDRPPDSAADPSGDSDDGSDVGEIGEDEEARPGDWGLGLLPLLLPLPLLLLGLLGLFESDMLSWTLIMIIKKEEQKE